MSKQILPKELAMIVTGLLVDPKLLGALDSVKSHQHFMHDIASVVALHCGGSVNQVAGGESSFDYMATEEDSPMVSISPDPSLPALHNNVWSAFDPDGWEDELVEDIATGTEMVTAERDSLIGSLSTLLINDRFAVPFTLTDLDSPPMFGTVHNNAYGLYVQVQGYSDNISTDNSGYLIHLENYQNQLRAIVYSDISIEDPTHTISLAGAKNSLR